MNIPMKLWLFIIAKGAMVMTKEEICHLLVGNPVIGAIRHEEDLESVKDSDIAVIFILKATIMNAKHLIEECKTMGKAVFIHLDFIEGLGKDEKAIEYVSKVLGPHGIITTRSQAIKYGNEQNLITIQRYFMIDSQSFHTAVHSIGHAKPDFIEVMPGIIPKVITKLTKAVQPPIIAGGLIQDKDDIIQGLQAGAIATSTANKKLWEL